MIYWLGVDGGGSNLRVAIVRSDMSPLHQIRVDGVNPNIWGREHAATRVQKTIKQALQEAEFTADQIQGVGVGIAGASGYHSEKWLRQVIAGILPGCFVVPSSDHEIALVGALGKHEGVLILSGTGSVAFGVNATGQSAQVGGWGYLIGDEGSGFRIGLDALQAVVQAIDGRGDSTELIDAITTRLELNDPLDLIHWLYHMPRNHDVAALAPLVMNTAAAGDSVAQQIIQSACDALTLHVTTVMKRLEMVETDFAFAGGLLQRPNLLSECLCSALRLESIPQASYPPVIGAALLAQLRKQNADRTTEP